MMDTLSVQRERWSLQTPRQWGVVPGTPSLAPHPTCGQTPVHTIPRDALWKAMPVFLHAKTFPISIF